ncbi:hypothetical protein ACXZ1K_19380 [Pedobacter sp. PWIIR3]
MIEKLNPIQRERADRLETQLKTAVRKRDIESAKRVIVDLQPIYQSTGNTAKLMQAKIRLYELSMDTGLLANATNGLSSIRVAVNKNTRTYLEASVLLAICYLRLKELGKAEPIIREVLINDDVIKSIEKRKAFRKNMIERFDEEGLLYALSEDVPTIAKHNYSEIQEAAVSLLRSNYDTQDLFDRIGSDVPSSAKNVLLRVDEFSKKQLPSAERIAIQSGAENLENKKVGKTLFSSMKRVVYNSICDKDSEIYKEWYQGGLTTVTSMITVLVADAFHSLNIAIRGIIVTVSALIIKFGIAIYCEHNKPSGILDLRA